ncbi:uncharacterized protein PV06_04383 [Exophiala oligosperma]|uniref:Uncharacterized protein n=1 Tax=Exophiala oligosperma TaxID=215243 RepID=A0A0D2C0M6_9EURO|nr:uncharacterized protein PV06_04383 [Exophiala oligosperma]KIW43262.1 hypothetical protein PV06_04383 [Exophiala oligosperma]
MGKSMLGNIPSNTEMCAVYTTHFGGILEASISLFDSPFQTHTLCGRRHRDWCLDARSSRHIHHQCDRSPSVNINQHSNFFELVCSGCSESCSYISGTDEPRFEYLVAGLHSGTCCARLRLPRLTPIVALEEPSCSFWIWNVILLDLMCWAFLRGAFCNVDNGPKYPSRNRGVGQQHLDLINMIESSVSVRMDSNGPGILVHHQRKEIARLVNMLGRRHRMDQNM